MLQFYSDPYSKKPRHWMDSTNFWGFFLFLFTWWKHSPWIGLGLGIIGLKAMGKHSDFVIFLFLDPYVSILNLNLRVVQFLQSLNITSMMKSTKSFRMLC